MPAIFHDNCHAILVTGKPLYSPEKGNLDKMSEKCRKKCPENVQKLSGGAENTIFGHFLDIFCVFGRCFCLVTLSNARPLQRYSSPDALQLEMPNLTAFFTLQTCALEEGFHSQPQQCILSGTSAIPPPYRAIGYSYTLSLFVFQV